MQNNDINRDDFLGKLIQQTELCCPSDDFVEKVMAKCCVEEVVPQQVIKTKFRLALPWLAGGLVFVTLFMLVFIFGGPILGGTLYSFFSGSVGTMGTILLKGLATLRLAYVGLTFGTLGGILLIINQIKQQRLTLRVV